MMNSTDIVKFQLKVKKEVDVTLRGISMEPMFLSGTTVVVEKCDKYKKGDIVLFEYENEGILIHRIIEIKDGYFFCKGDNAFRMEKISEKGLIGKITRYKNCGEYYEINYGNFFYMTTICFLSRQINKKFIKYNLDWQRCKREKEYKLLFYLLKKLMKGKKIYVGN